MNTYPVNDIYPCIQGEGALTGTPMALLRLHGCPVACPFCDTKETWHTDVAHRVPTITDALGTNERWARAAPADIAAYVAKQCPMLNWVLLTGGEPAMQPLSSLVAALHALRFKVAVETSGTSDGVLGADIDWLCVSPKIDMPGGRSIVPEVIAVADELKFVVGKPADIDKIKQYLELWKVVPEWQIVSVQPMSASERATQLCIETALATGWRVSLQMHKYLGQR